MSNSEKPITPRPSPPHRAFVVKTDERLSFEVRSQVCDALTGYTHGEVVYFDAGPLGACYATHMTGKKHGGYVLPRPNPGRPPWPERISHEQ